MSQVPLAPPPQTGQPIDSWLYLLWRRLTQAGQILWGSIVPGTSADVEDVVTDATGTAGSLVFSGNPTLQGMVIDGIFYQGDTTPVVGPALLGGMLSTDTASGYNLIMRKAFSGTSPPGFGFFKARGTAASPSVISTGDQIGSLNFVGYDGSSYSTGITITGVSEGTIGTSKIPAYLKISTADASSGVVTEAFRIDSARTVTLGGASTAPALKVTPVASQARWVEVTGATSSTNPTIGVSGGNLDISASVAITGVVSTSGYTVATLPAGTVGHRAYVTDALAPAYGVAVAGGGAVTIPVFYNGAAWICA